MLGLNAVPIGDPPKRYELSLNGLSRQSTRVLYGGGTEILSFTKIINEVEQITEPSSQVLSQILGIIDEMLNISTSNSRFRGLIRYISEFVQSTESNGKVAGLIKIINDTVSVAESVFSTLAVAANQLIRVVDESLYITEGAYRLLGLVKTINETNSISESIVGGLQNLVKVVNEAYNIVEESFKLSNLIRVVNETVGAIENVIDILVTNVTSIIKTVNENVNALEDTIFSGLQRIIGYLKVKFDIKPAIKTVLRILKDDE